MKKQFLILFMLSLFFIPAKTASAKSIRIGSKPFAENYLLAEMMAQMLESRGYVIERVYGLGGTMVCFEALRSGEIDLYPEYTGTILKQILRTEEEDVNQSLRRRHRVEILPSFGFSNAYAIAVTEETARQHNLQKISDLKFKFTLKGGLSYEFMRREDGWQELVKTYKLYNAVVGIEHSLAYEALLGSSVDFIDVYTTDAKIDRLHLKLLQDDLNFFPVYQAVPFVRSDLSKEVKSILMLMANKINETEMIRLNTQVEIEKLSFEEAAKKILQGKGLLKKTPVFQKVSSEEKMEEGKVVESVVPTPQRSLIKDLLRRTAEHLFMTVIALLLGTLVAIPVGIAAYRKAKTAQWVLPATGLLQTIPGIALLTLMIPLLGIGKFPAIVALFLYSLLPIVRNTYVGLHDIEEVYRETARALGMTPAQRLMKVEIPMAYPTIVAGIKTAAVINIGTATLAAFIGAGGLGEPIVTGLALNNHTMIMEGAIPAAVLALVTELGFRFFDPRRNFIQE